MYLRWLLEIFSTERTHTYPYGYFRRHIGDFERKLESPITFSKTKKKFFQRTRMVREPIVYHLYSVEYWFKIIQDSYTSLVGYMWHLLIENREIFYRKNLSENSIGPANCGLHKQSLWYFGEDRINWSKSVTSIWFPLSFKKLVAFNQYLSDGRDLNICQ